MIHPDLPLSTIGLGKSTQSLRLNRRGLYFLLAFALLDGNVETSIASLNRFEKNGPADENRTHI